MRILAKEKISAHRYKTPEGYLVCVDAILARTGKQQYRHNELFSDSSKDDIVDVDRPYEEVFSEKTIASFENKPFVNEHPHEDVNVYNHRDYAVGFVRDVHQGEVDGEPVLLGNIIVTDEEAIADIESGNKVELSCGYDCDIADEENLCQRNIRGNHVALCKAGRAGIARIIDSKVEDSTIYVRVDKKDLKSTYRFESYAKANDVRVVDLGSEYRLEGKRDDLEYVFDMFDLDPDDYIEDSIKDSAEYSKGQYTFEIINSETNEQMNIVHIRANSKEEAWKKAKSKYAGRKVLISFLNYMNLEDSVKDSAEDDFYDDLFSSNLKYEFIKGGYGIKFKTSRDYQKAKEMAKQNNYTKGKWYDKDLEFFEYGGITISNEDSIKDVDIKNRKTRLLKIFKQYNYNRDEAIAEVNSIKGIDEDDIATLVDWIVDIYKDFYTLKDSIEDADERLYPELKKIAEEYNLAKKGQSNSKTSKSDLRYVNKKHEIASDLRNKLLKEWNSVVNTLSKTYQLILGKEPSLIKVEEFKKMLKGEKHKNDSVEEIMKDKLENKQVKVRIKFDSNKEANDALKMLHRKEDFMNSDLIFDDTVEVLTTDVLVDTLKKALKMYFIKNINVIDSVEDSEEVVEDGRLIEPEEKYIKEFEKMIQRLGFKIDKTGKTITGRTHYQIMSLRNGYTEAEYKRIVKELEKISNTMRSWEIPMTYNIGLHYDGYISAGLDLDKQWVEDSVEDSIKDEAIYMYIADPDEEEDKEIIDRAKSNGLKLEKSGGLTKVIGNLSQLAKALKMSKEDIVSYSKQPRSTIKKVKDSTETTKNLDSIKLINIIKAAKSTKTSCNDAMELSAKTSEELDKLMKQYQKKHPEWKFGEIKKDKGLYRCSVVKDSKVNDIKNTEIRNLSQKQLSVLKENCLKTIKEGKPGLVETAKETLDKVEKELKRRSL